MAFAQKWKTENPKEAEKRIDLSEIPLDLSCHNRKKESRAIITSSPAKLKVFSKPDETRNDQNVFKKLEKNCSIESPNNQKAPLSKDFPFTKQLKHEIRNTDIDENSKFFEKKLKYFFPTAPEITTSGTRTKYFGYHPQTSTNHLPQNPKLQKELRQNSFLPHPQADVPSQSSQLHHQNSNLHLAKSKLFGNQNEAQSHPRPCVVTSTETLLQQLSLRNLHFSVPYLYNTNYFSDIISYLAPFIKSSPTNGEEGFLNKVPTLCSNKEKSPNHTQLGHCSYQDVKQTTEFQRLPTEEKNVNEGSSVLQSQRFSMINKNSEIPHGLPFRNPQDPERKISETNDRNYFSENQLNKNGRSEFPSVSYSFSQPRHPRPVDFKPCKITCGLCGRTYATEGALAKHMKGHEDPKGENSFKCKMCKKSCSTLGALRMHIRTHTLPCECHICGKAFSRTWLLQGHIRTHTGEKPYQCTKCSRAFADRSNLRAHMQTHEVIKRYSCKRCEKTFSRISLLKRHQRHCDATIANESGETQELPETEILNQKNDVNFNVNSD